MKILLYFGPSGIGDWCMIWPSIPALLQQEECDQLHLIIPYKNAGNQLLLDHPLVSKITYLERKLSGIGLVGYGFRWLKILTQLYKQRYSVIAVSYLSNQIDNLLLCALSRIPKRIGRDFPHSSLYSLAFTDIVHSKSDIGRVRIHLNYLNDEPSHPSHHLKLFSRRFTIPNQTQSLLKTPYIVLAAGGGRDAQWKFWGGKHYFELIQRHPSICFVLLGHGHDDEQQAESILSYGKSPNLVNLTSQTSMEVALEIIRGAAAVVGNDTGIPNISAVLGIPTLAIFGPTNPDIVGASLLGAAETHINVPCGPCFDDTQNTSSAIKCSHRQCLNNLSSSTVNKALEPLIKELFPS